MSWIRLDDTYISHPKFVVLSDRAFRLWHEGMAHCRRHLTDGHISPAALKTFKSARATAVTELTTPCQPSISPLWEPVADGFVVHDYLVWNRSREAELQDRDQAKKRSHVHRTHAARAPNVLVQEKDLDQDPDRKEKRSTERAPEIKPVTTAGETVEMRAGHLVERYGELYLKHRHGARYRPRPNLDWHDAIELCQIWDDARLEKLAVIVLTTDDDWIAKTDRSFHIFSIKSSWADDRLKAWELEHGVQT